ncbi:TRAP transporter small permease subunit [Pseudomaricurvus sp. HS19]|uniref:TRAP transporter small permease subunit n=1 Tax=Pseudomaricurvus sp. HS19 TaxID=2692626 RepID=UPI001367AF21|nr:TRAP transporter small permease subunit [Pseudomaricurvus sp. HS19]MYM63808.1 TRAP transporter small permease subunit [Pseudomaricurvus sp. HS19]
MSPQYSGIRGVLAWIDAFAQFTGRWIALLTLLMMLLTCVIVVLRYGFSLGSIALQESVGYLHSAVFLLAMASTLQRDGHVRVDIFYRRFSRAKQAWVNALGSLLFLLPVAGFLLFSSWNYVADAWAVREGSSSAGGLPLVYLLKSLIPLTAVLLALQAIGEVLRGLLVLLQEPQASGEGSSHD